MSIVEQLTAIKQGKDAIYEALDDAGMSEPKNLAGVPKLIGDVPPLNSNILALNGNTEEDCLIRLIERTPGEIIIPGDIALPQYALPGTNWNDANWDLKLCGQENMPLNTIANFAKGARSQYYSLSSVAYNGIIHIYTIYNSQILNSGSSLGNFSSFGTLNYHSLDALTKSRGFSYDNSGAGANPLNRAINIYLDGDVITELKISDDANINIPKLFSKLTFLEKVYLPKDITPIPYYIFRECTKLKDVYINSNTPPNLSYYNNQSYAFPDTVEKIHAPVGADWSSSTSIYTKWQNKGYANKIVYDYSVPIEESTPKTIWDYLKDLKDCKINIFQKLSDRGVTTANKSWSDIANMIESINKSTNTSYRNYLTGEGEIIIPNSCTAIGALGLAYKGMQFVNIPANVTSIHESSFFNSPNIINITVDPENTVYTSQDANGNECNCIMNKTRTILYHGCKNTTIPNTITTIAQYAFYNRDITNFTMPSSLPNFAINSMRGNPNIEITYNSLYDLANAKSGVQAYDDQPLTWIDGTINNSIGHKISINGIEPDENGKIKVDFTGSGITKIKQGAMSYINNIKELNLSGITEIGTMGIINIVKYAEKITIDTGITFGQQSLLTNGKPQCKFYIDSWKTFCECGSSGTISTDDGVPFFMNNTQESNIYINNTSLQDIIDNSSGILNLQSVDTTKLGNQLFQSKKWLNAIIMPSTLKSIGIGTFYGCSNLTSITIPNSVTSIGSQAFRGCTGLTDISIGTGVTTILWGAFWGCSGLTSIIIPDNVTSMQGNETFKGCTNLTSIVIGNGVRLLGYGAFNGCVNLIRAEFASIKHLCSITFSSLESDYVNPLYYAGHLYVTGNPNEITEVSIPNDITQIKLRAFTGAKYITKFVMEGNISSIGNHAFYNCVSCTLYDFRNQTGNVPTLNSKDAFGSNITDNRSVWYIVVPDDLVSNWKAAANWSDQSIVGHIISATDYTNEVL